MHGSRWDMLPGQVATKEVAVDHEIGEETAIRRKIKFWPKYPMVKPKMKLGNWGIGEMKFWPKYPMVKPKMKLGKKQPFVAK